MTKLRSLLLSRFEDIFKRLEAGEDVPPSLRLRTEGLLEALVLIEEATVDELDKILEDLHKVHRGASLTEELGADWRHLHPFPELPLWMDRAPVFPSTSD